jgi:uncharacterized membrane protein
MDYVMVLLRLLHIIAGVFWAGSAFLLAGFISPAVRAAGAEGSKFMQTLMQRTRFADVMAITAAVTVVCGVLMYWRDSGGLDSVWILTARGLALTIGSLAGIAAMIIGGGVTGRVTARVAALGKEMQAAGGPPKPAQIGEMQSLQKRLTQAGDWGAILLLITVAGMAASRYV